LGGQAGVSTACQSRPLWPKARRTFSLNGEKS
jgi:hypothetical protein